MHFSSQEPGKCSWVLINQHNISASERNIFIPCVETEAPGSRVSYKGSKRSSSLEKRICLIGDNSELRNTLCNWRRWVLCFSWLIPAERCSQTAEPRPNVIQYVMPCWSSAQITAVCNSCQHIFYLNSMRAPGLKVAKTVTHSIFRGNSKEKVQWGQIFMPYPVVL